jgi:hypothetical protein
MEFSSPPAPEKSQVNPVGAAIIAITADKAGKGDRACPVSRIACADWQRHAGFNSRLERDGGVEE